jgi:hypothetical protein
MIISVTNLYIFYLHYIATGHEQSAHYANAYATGELITPSV